MPRRSLLLETAAIGGTFSIIIAFNALRCSTCWTKNLPNIAKVAPSAGDIREAHSQTTHRIMMKRMLHLRISTDAKLVDMDCMYRDRYIVMTCRLSFRGR